MKICVSCYTSSRSVGYPNPGKSNPNALFASENKLRKFANVNSPADSSSEQKPEEADTGSTSSNARSTITYRRFYEIDSKDQWKDLQMDLHSWEASIANANQGYRVSVQEFKDAKSQILKDIGYANKPIKDLPSRDADSVRKKLQSKSFHYTRVQFVIQKADDDDSGKDFAIIKSKVGHYLRGYNAPKGFEDTQIDPE